jgi:hypothetical protein
VGTKISEAGGGEEGVAGSMGGDIGVGVPGQSSFTRPGQPGQRERPVIAGEGMHVHADSDAWQG